MWSRSATSSRSSAWGSTSRDASSSRRRRPRWTATGAGRQARKAGFPPTPSGARKACSRGPGPGCVRLLGLLAAAFLTAAAPGEEPKARPFAWKSTYAEGRAAAEGRGRPLLLYFPPIDTAKEPRAIALAPRALGVPPFAEGTRVGAGEILELMKRFEVKQVPALLLLDRRENVIQRWEGEGKVPANAWAVLEALVRRLEKRDEDDLKTLREARGLAAGGDP